MKLLVVLLVLASLSLASTTAPPKFPTEYVAVGVILLPYAEIREPFTAYYDGLNGQSRIDYYDDLMLTLQKSSSAAGENLNYGVEYKIAYDVDPKGRTQRVCFQANGSTDATVSAQTILPDLTGFQQVGKEACPSVSIQQMQWNGVNQRSIKNEFSSVRSGHHGRHCEKWQLVNKFEDKVSTYNFWLRRTAGGDAIPVHYEMLGFNSLLGSHYDQYEIAYHTFRPGNVSEDIFNIDNHFDCQGFPGPGAKRLSKVTMNPIGHLLGSRPHVDVQDEFENFRVEHGKNYKHKLEEVSRSHIYLHNVRFIEAKNRQQKHYRLAVNHLADRTKDELSVLRGRIKTKGFNGGKPYRSNLKTGELPPSWDWRLVGAVTPVRDQAICGSCWTFGTIGAITGAYFSKYGKLVQFSEQQLVDCSWNEGNNGCDGGEDWRVYNYMMKNGGLATDDDYGHYLGVDGKCHANDVKKSVQITGFVNITQYDVEAFKKALYENATITIAINAAVKTFSFYSHGVYYDSDCLGDEDHLDHQVLLVGYGTLYGKDYWLVKNSWSTHWGNDGYILISQKDNMCGVTTDGTIPTIA